MNNDDVSSTDINKVAKDICNIFTKSAKESFGIYSTGQYSKDKERNKPWFNRECKTARRKFHLAKRMHNLCKSEENKQNLRETSRSYKKVMDNSIRKYKADLTRKLMQLRTTNTKAYWKILNSTNKESKSAVNIGEVFKYLKSINECNNVADDDAFDLSDREPESGESSNDILNGEISESEIIEAVNKLKNGKASGIDCIVNEHISSTLYTFLPVYKMFFNIIFDSGLVPDEWLVGIVKPIYKNKGDPTTPENYRPITLLSCLGKLFTCILSKRLELYADEIKLIQENQAGFRKEYSTLDHILTLHLLSNTLMKSETPEDLQNALNEFESYCSEWKLQ
ncbi:uncharacterized protein LOC134269832, partial [Saccostrea cucullata]|uniref:uncharacterized protein LOC134269832 n=1 Tax=Saccostrea cuccullata TaxID=36930 RepID=UPI002ED26B01